MERLTRTNTVGFQESQIVAADSDASIIELLEQDPALRNATAIVGVFLLESSKKKEKRVERVEKNESQ